MTNTDTRDVAATLAQIGRMHAEGCEIVRVAIPRRDALAAFGEIVAASPLPVVADVHFDHTIAVDAARAGAAKLRINPGNIGDLSRVDAVIDAAGEAGIPIRIGVNAGTLAEEYRDLDWSLERKLADERGRLLQAFRVPRLLRHRRQGQGVERPRVRRGVPPARRARSTTRCTSASPRPERTFAGTIKSSVGLGVLLADGIGDTLRVSLTADPVEEVRVGWEILSALDIRRRGPEMVSCPTCGRCEIDLIPIAEEVERRLRGRTTPVKVAVMGCVVNGPGEARDADIGVAAGAGVGLIFAKGETVRKVPETEIVDALFAEIERFEAAARVARRASSDKRCRCGIGILPVHIHITRKRHHR